MFQALLFNIQIPATAVGNIALQIAFFICVLLLVQAFQFRRKDLNAIFKSNVLAKTTFYTVCFYLLLIYGSGSGKEFIYFQF